MQARGALGKRAWGRLVLGADLSDPATRRRWLVETSLHGDEWQADGIFPVADGSPARRWFATVQVAGGVVTRVW